MADVVRVNGTSLFVDDRGTANAPALLFVHGGPGNSCWDFMTSVGDLLVDRGLRVIGVDQRGVLRSDPLPDRPALTTGVLIEDFEAIRRTLGINRWSALGHSAGGAYLLDYAIARPEVFEVAIFDAPSWDCDATDRYRLPVAADLLENAGKTQAAAVCRAAAAAPHRLQFDPQVLAAMQQLGPDYLRLFTYDEQGLATYLSLAQQAPTDLDWTRGASHLPLIADMYQDRTSRLAELNCRSALFVGARDLVCPPEMIETYRAATGGQVVIFERSGHFAYVEQPQGYADSLADTITSAPTEGIVAAPTDRHS